MNRQWVGRSTQVICCIGRLSLSLEIFHGQKYHFVSFDDYVVGLSLFSLVMFLWTKFSFYKLKWYMPMLDFFLMHKVIDQIISDNLER